MICKNSKSRRIIFNELSFLKNKTQLRPASSQVSSLVSASETTCFHFHIGIPLKRPIEIKENPTSIHGSEESGTGSEMYDEVENVPLTPTM